MIKGQAIAAAFIGEGGAGLADALVGSIFLPNAGNGTGFEIIRVDRSTATVTVTRTNGQPLDVRLASGGIDPAPAFITAWTTDRHVRDLRTLRLAGIASEFDACDAAALSRCLRDSMPGVAEWRAAVAVTQHHRTDAVLKAVCAYRIELDGPRCRERLHEIVVELRNIKAFSEALDLFAAIESGPVEDMRTGLVFRRAALLMDMVEHCGDRKALAKAKDCIALLDRVAPEETGPQWGRWSRLARITRS